MRTLETEIVAAEVAIELSSQSEMKRQNASNCAPIAVTQLDAEADDGTLWM